MYLTETDRIVAMIRNNGNPTDSDVIKDIISEDEKSDRKKEMKEGEEYYAVKQDILNIDFNVAEVDGEQIVNPNASNNKLVHAIHTLLVNQKMFYIISEGLQIESKDENLEKEIDDIFGHKFDVTLNKWGTGASNKGDEAIHPYIDVDGKIKFTIINSRELILVYDSAYEDELTLAFRYYTFPYQKTKMSPKRILHKVEIWDKEKVTYYVEKENGDYEKDSTQQLNPRYHFYGYNSSNPDNKVGRGWGKVPFIILKNNNLSMSDLKLYKTLVDDYDFNRSDLSNNLKDIQELFWVLFGADSTNLSEFFRNLKKYKGMKVPDGAKVEDKRGELPTEAGKTHTDSLWEDIFITGMGVDYKSDIFKNPPSGVALRTMFAGLDLKANALIIHWKIALEQLGWFICEYLNLVKKKKYDYKSLTYSFKKALIINDLEQAQIAQISEGVISDETRRDKHPWNKDKKLEDERIEKEKSEQTDRVIKYMKNKNQNVNYDNQV